jgi:long-subunit fatty acid transport protein
MAFRNIFLIGLFIVTYNVSVAQESTKKWAMMGAYEVNYTGRNAILHAQYHINNHELEAGVNYNFSDGFSNNPVVGVGLSYSYVVLHNEHWSLAAGLHYRRQKPLAIVNIQTITYTNGLTYHWKPKIAFTARLGYGVVAERAASAGNFSQNNNLTGSFTLGCVYRLSSL